MSQSSLAHPVLKAPTGQPSNMKQRRPRFAISLAGPYQNTHVYRGRFTGTDGEQWSTEPDVMLLVAGGSHESEAFMFSSPQDFMSSDSYLCDLFGEADHNVHSEWLEVASTILNALVNAMHIESNITGSVLDTYTFSRQMGYWGTAEAARDPESIKDKFQIRQTLNELKMLEDGWADGMQYVTDWGNGYGKAPLPEDLDWLADQMEDHYHKDLPYPYIYPEPEGGVQIEWSIGPYEAGLTIDLCKREGEWSYTNCDKHESGEEEVLALTKSTSWTWLATELKRLRSLAS